MHDRHSTSKRVPTNEHSRVTQLRLRQHKLYKIRNPHELVILIFVVVERQRERLDRPTRSSTSHLSQFGQSDHRRRGAQAASGRVGQLSRAQTQTCQDLYPSQWGREPASHSILSTIDLDSFMKQNKIEKNNKLLKNFF